MVRDINRAIWMNLKKESNRYRNKKQIDAQKLVQIQNPHGKRQLKHVPIIKLLLYLIDHDVKQERKNNMHSKL